VQTSSWFNELLSACASASKDYFTPQKIQRASEQHPCSSRHRQEEHIHVCAYFDTRHDEARAPPLEEDEGGQAGPTRAKVSVKPAERGGDMLHPGALHVFGSPHAVAVVIRGEAQHWVRAPSALAFCFVAVRFRRCRNAGR